MTEAIATGPFRTIAEIRRKNQSIGHHWFDRSTIEFFKTRFESDVLAGRFFVTSEQPPSGPREFSVRRANDDGTVSTIVSALRVRPSDPDVLMLAVAAELAENAC